MPMTRPPAASVRSLLPVTLAALAALAILVGLGVWQLQRLAWKEGLIATLEQRVDAEPVTLAEAEGRAERDGREIDWLRLRVSGRFVAADTLYVYATQDGMAGWRAVTPFESEAGRTVLVDRGFVPDTVLRAEGAGSPPAEGSVEVMGLARIHGEGQGPFTPDNDAAANRWYWWDIPAMARVLGLDASGTVTGFVIEAEPGAWSGAGPWPKVVRREPALPNRHFEYALTWFGLALCLVGVYAAFVVSRLTGRED